MKRLTESEVEATHRIFNHVDNISEAYYGKKTQNQAKKFVSQNRWIMFPVHNVTSLREGTMFPAPNVYVSFDGEEVADDGDGRVNGWVGVTYNNTESMTWLGEVLKYKNASLFTESIQSLGPNWIAFVEQKIKTNYQDNTPIYKTIKKFDAESVTALDIQNAIKLSNGHLLRPGDDYEGEPVLWCVTVFSVCRHVSEATFDQEVKVAFDFFVNALNLR